MKKIGFIDYYLSEWHANNYPAWIKNAASASEGEEMELAYAWAELDVSPLDGVTTDEWCKKFGAERCHSIEELCEKSDCIVILAPSNPECHLGYAKVALPYGKRTYIDKTFAPDYETAREIFDIAKKHGTPFFSTSALRYATEIAENEGNTAYSFIAGGGSNADEYIIHTLEMTVKCFGIGAKALKVSREGKGYLTEIEYDGGRIARVFFAEGIPFTAILTNTDGDTVSTSIDSPFFDYLLADIVRFFREGTPSFNPEETLEVMKLRGAFVRTKDTGETVTL